MRKIKFWVKQCFINLYLGILNFVLYPLLLLLLPSRIPEGIPKLQGELTYVLARGQRRKVTHLLSNKVPAAKDPREARRIAREYFRILYGFYYYSLFLAVFRVRWLSRYVEYEGLEFLEESLKEQKGVIMPLLHFNHPVAVPVFFIYKGMKTSVYAVHPWDLNVPFVLRVNTWLSYTLPGLKGDLEMAYRNRGARDVYIRRLQENALFMVYIDGFFPGRKGLKEVHFLGERVLFPSGITDIVRETGSPVHIAYSVRDRSDWRRAKVTVSPRLPMTGDPDEDLQTIVRAHEAAVLKHPEQWWGWSKFERVTLAYQEATRRKEPEEKGGGDPVKG